MTKWLLRSVCQVVYSLGGFYLLLLFERLFGRRRHVIVLVYHHLRGGEACPPTLSSLAEGTPHATFERHLRMFRRWYQPITLDTLERVVDGRAILPNDALLVTFDDGYRDNRVLGGPGLRRSGLTGVIFVATGFVGSGRRYWWIWLDDILGAISPQDWHAAVQALPGHTPLQPTMLPAEIDGLESRRTVRATLSKLLHEFEADDQQRVLEHLARYAGCPTATRLPVLSWDEICSMRREGFDFGGHTHIHPRLPRLDAEAIRQGLRESQRIMAEQLGQPARSFAYPFGEYNQAAVQAVAEAGFRLAFTTRPGAIAPGAGRAHELPRIGLWREGTGETAATIVALKLSKYLPRAAGAALSRLLGDPWQK